MEQPINSNPAPLSDEALEEIATLVVREITERPPTVGLIGVSGVGKSSTINALFRTKLATSDTVACTKAFEHIDLALEFLRGQVKAKPVSLRVVDAPGLGEDIVKDPAYLELYRTHLEKCDVILWVMSARNRAIALDQMYLEQLSQFHPKMVFGINQADLVEPMDWRESFNIPSRQQEANLKVIQQDRMEKIGQVLGREVPILCYSSKRGYRLEMLFKMILEACPLERRWIYDGLKNFSYRDFIPNSPSMHTVGFLTKLFSSHNKEKHNELAG